MGVSGHQGSGDVGVNEAVELGAVGDGEDDSASPVGVRTPGQMTGLEADRMQATINRGMTSRMILLMANSRNQIKQYPSWL